MVIIIVEINKIVKMMIYVNVLINTTPQVFVMRSHGS